MLASIISDSKKDDGSTISESISTISRELLIVVDSSVSSIVGSELSASTNDNQSAESELLISSGSNADGGSIELVSTNDSQSVEYRLFLS
jgi:hypothetical protein